MAIKNTIFMEAKNKALAAKISIKSPEEFKRSIRELKKGGLTTTEKRALVLARTRAKIMMKRKKLCLRERIEMARISKMKI